MPARPSILAQRQFFAWQGWRLDLPAEWNPLRIAGGWREGFVLLADLHRPRLALRWGVIRQRRFDARDWAQRAIRDEVGQLASRAAEQLPLRDANLEASMLYLEREPPGRDVWVAFSRATGRGVQLIHHAQRRDARFAGALVPALSDTPPDEPVPWSVFDLNCTVPAGMKLRSHQLAAGDLRLSFGDSGRLLSVRQIAVARLALSRLPLDRWLLTEQRTRAMHYRATGGPAAIELQAAEGRVLRGLAARLTRRRRAWFMRWLPPQLIAAALHDEARDRLVLLQASDNRLLEEIAQTVGSHACARPPQETGATDPRQKR